MNHFQMATFTPKAISFKKLTPAILKDALLDSLRQFLAFENPLKKMKNAFQFTLKVVSFSRYLNVCLDFLVM